MRIRNRFDEFVCLRSNLSNDNIISAKRPGLKMDMDFKRSGLKTSVENYIFWSEIGSGFGEPGGTPPPRIPSLFPDSYIHNCRKTALKSSECFLLVFSTPRPRDLFV